MIGPVNAPGRSCSAVTFVIPDGEYCNVTASGPGPAELL